MVVKIVGSRARYCAVDWCAENLGLDNKWSHCIDTALGLYSDQWTYDFIFDSESDAVWFALAHVDHLYQKQPEND